jgi:autotransporter family porin
VTGGFRGTTDEILAWAACKWGLAPDLLRAAAAQESGWRQATIGDDGTSFGLLQIKDHRVDGAAAWGGYPDTLQSTAVNADFYGAYLRACLDGAFYDGGQWLYRGETIDQVVARRGHDAALWGCVGSWYSGEWYDADARGYIARVRARLTRRDWPGAQR